MDQFKFYSLNIDTINVLDGLINEGNNLGLDLNDISKKIDSIRSMVQDGIIRIVLLGSFSDGKTSAIAGLLGRLEGSMKIDADESSDQLDVYRPDGLKKGFEIVDTPGLFGTKEKEIDGRLVRFSDITEKYISEAHLLIYVCDAVVPLKDSHVPIIKKVLRDYNKLDSTIFVINKMDEAGYDLTDENDYNSGTNIKKAALITRLRSTINLTPDEERHLHIVCVSADPKGKGLNYWFSKPEDYLKRSHITNLRDEVTNVVNKCNINNIQLQTLKTSISDALIQVCKIIEQNNEIVEDTTNSLQESCDELKTELDYSKKVIDESRSSIDKNIASYFTNLRRRISDASLETFYDVLENYIGIQDNKITFYLVDNSINRLMMRSLSGTIESIDNLSDKFKTSFDFQRKIINDALSSSKILFTNVKVSSDTVMSIRDFAFKNFKFKPWGAKKLAGSLNATLSMATTVLDIIGNAYDYFKELSDTKKMESLKSKIKNSLNNSENSINNMLYDKNEFYQKFAPEFIDMKNALEQRNKEIDELRHKNESLMQYKHEIQSFLKRAKNVEYYKIS